ncbi:MAG: DNA polymerase III subunit beta [Patescibacteria group bacterium]|jgi:DNA polymerase-3 subunit beta|nr:DNA polymerase III subunit beta [Patescibacteria group bacterium]
MKLVCLQNNLKKGLAIVSHINNKNINLPILNNILIRANEAGVELISTNLEMGITHQLRGKVEDFGEITIDSKLFSDYVNLLPEDKVEFLSEKLDINIKCGNYKTKMKGEDAKEFPLIPIIDKNDCCSLNIFDFKKAVSSVVFSVASSDNRMELSGVYFKFNDKKLILAATDSYRLAEKSVDLKDSSIKDKDIIVPAKTVNEVLRIISSVTSDVKNLDSDLINICISDNQILFSFSSVELISRTINGQYPDYKQIIPDKYKTEAEISKEDFLRAVKASSVFSKNGVYDVSLVFHKKNLNIYSSSNQSGESSIDIPCDFSGDDNDIAINYRYVLDALNVIEGETVSLKVINNNTPCQISSPNDESYLYIIMPIRN